MAHAAYLRTESRGAHFRKDFPNSNDDVWKKRQTFTKDFFNSVKKQTKEV
ncbi:MAG TPA: hypothetical protein PLB98_02115 [bacterium]|nr:hypothetical protein [bacterium]